MSSDTMAVVGVSGGLFFLLVVIGMCCCAFGAARKSEKGVARIHVPPDYSNFRRGRRFTLRMSGEGTQSQTARLVAGNPPNVLTCPVLDGTPQLAPNPLSFPPLRDTRPPELADNNHNTITASSASSYSRNNVLLMASTSLFLPHQSFDISTAAVKSHGPAHDSSATLPGSPAYSSPPTLPGEAEHSPYQHG